MLSLSEHHCRLGGFGEFHVLWHFKTIVSIYTHTVYFNDISNDFQITKAYEVLLLQKGNFLFLLCRN